jgi:choline dehydrogenase-like flavoprotein
MTEEFDAIVIGSGVTGGFAAKELCEKGLKTLLLERGRDLEHQGPDYTDGLMPWERTYFGEEPEWYTERHPHLKQYFADPDALDWFVTQDVQPYSVAEGTRFNWIRTYNLGGRSMFWARKTFRMGDADFRSNARDGHGVPWPIGYDDLKRWYDYVERFIGVSGDRDGIETLPDSVVQPGFEFTSVEKAFREVVEKEFPGRRVIMSRVANLTEPTVEQAALGRGQCQARNTCRNGCSFGAYYSTQSAALPAANRTGNLTVLTNSIVNRIVTDSVTGRAIAVEVIDAQTRAAKRYSSRIVFLNASAVASAQVLLNSTSDANPNGVANQAGVVGRYLNDHCGGITVRGTTSRFADSYYSGRRPTGFYIPRFRNFAEAGDGYLRGFGFQGSSERSDWRRGAEQAGLGTDAKYAMRRPGPWSLRLNMFGESLPRFENRMTLHPSLRDKWGMPLVHFSAGHGDNEARMKKEAERDGVAMLTAAGFDNISVSRDDEPVGNKIHEFGTVVMGADPSASALNSFNQAHTCANLFVTDGAAMPSAGCQNPSLTYLALTARAADYAVRLMKQGRL